MKTYKTIDDFLNDQPEDKRLQVEALQKIIAEVAPELDEHIKWNAPSYVLNGEDRLTFNINNKEGLVKLVFHMGATRKEDKNSDPVMQGEALIEWVSDIRGYMTFHSLKEIADNKASIKQAVKKWLAQSLDS